MARTLCGEDRYPTVLLAVASHGLPDAQRRFPRAPLEDAEWAAVVEAARTHRVTGQLAAATADGTLPATNAQQREAHRRHRGMQLWVLALEGRLTAVVDRLADAGVDSRVLKGSAVAHLDYAEPAVRSYVDLDVLVRADDIEGAVRALATEGFQRTLAEPRPGFDRRFDKGMTLRPPDGYELDLHRTFVLGPWGALMKPAALWDEGQCFTIGGRPLRALTPSNRFLHACYHATLGDWPLRLGSLRDVAEMLRGANATTVLRTAASWRAEAVVAVAVTDTGRLLGLRLGGELASWAAEYALTRRDEAWLALHNNPDKTFAAQALATLRVLRWRDKLGYVRALAMPDRTYTSDRHVSALSRFRYAVAQVRLGSGARRKV